MIEGVDYLLDVACDGQRLWVTGPDGSCVARFDKRFGVDVHRTAAAQLAGAPECLYCTHASAGPEEWRRFRQEVLSHHGIVVPEDALTFP